MAIDFTSVARRLGLVAATTTAILIVGYVGAFLVVDVLPGVLFYRAASETAPPHISKAAGAR